MLLLFLDHDEVFVKQIKLLIITLFDGCNLPVREKGKERPYIFILFQCTSDGVLFTRWRPHHYRIASLGGGHRL